MQDIQVIKHNQQFQFQLVPIRADGTLGGRAIQLELETQQFCRAMVALYRKVGFEPPWLGYVAVDGNSAVGGGAFVWPPADNRVENAYYTDLAQQGRGYATLTAKHLLRIARDMVPQVELSAKTEPQPNASTKILTGLGFTKIGSTADEEIGEAWLWLLKL